MVQTKVWRAVGRIALGAMLAVGLSAASANASSLTFDLTGGAGDGTVGNQLSWTNGGVTVYATAWSASTTNFNKAALGQYSLGLGVCNGDEHSYFIVFDLGCNSPNHAVDNNNQRDFVLFLFSGAVDMKSLEVAEISNDTDVSYWLGNVAGPANQTGLLTGKSTGSLPLGFGARIDNDGDNDRTFNLDNVNTTYNALLVGASLAGDFDDFFKIKTLKVDYTESTVTTQAAVPEPASLVLFGTGLVGLAAAARRRKLLNRPRA